HSFLLSLHDALPISVVRSPVVPWSGRSRLPSYLFLAATFPAAISRCRPRQNTVFLTCDHHHTTPRGLNNREVSFSGNDTTKSEPGSLQQHPEFRLRTLSAARRQHQHFKIKELAEVRPVARRDDRVNY